MSGIAKVDAVVIFVIQGDSALPVGDLSDFCYARELLVGHEKVRSKVINCKPDRLVIVEYAPMHLKGCCARVPALIVGVVFTPQTASLIEVHVPSAYPCTPESNRSKRPKLQLFRCITFHSETLKMARECTPVSGI
jgi:hypothetical protein